MKSRPETAHILKHHFRSQFKNLLYLGTDINQLITTIRVQNIAINHPWHTFSNPSEFGFTGLQGKFYGFAIADILVSPQYADHLTLEIAEGELVRFCTNNLPISMVLNFLNPQFGSLTLDHCPIIGSVKISFRFPPSQFFVCLANNLRDLLKSRIVQKILVTSQIHRIDIFPEHRQGKSIQYRLQKLFPFLQFLRSHLHPIFQFVI